MAAVVAHQGQGKPLSLLMGMAVLAGNLARLVLTGQLGVRPLVL
jgi:hypothetical protein